MDFFPDLETFQHWLVNYGSIALFILLALGIVALPIPEETLMILAGTLMGSDILQIIPTIVAALAGSIFGITLSYILGRTLGIFFVHKYGGWVGIKEEHIQRVHNWFEKYGKWSLIIGYFIPGVRHFTGFIAGTTGLEYNHFALFAYSGALLWVTTFLSLGYFFGNLCVEYCKQLAESEYIFITGLIALAAVFSYFMFMKVRKKNNNHKT